MIITQTPLRVSFLGGNTDFLEYAKAHGGFVVTSTIDKYIYCIVKKRFDDLIIVNYSIKETVEDINELQHELVREALRLLHITQGIEISFLADIPTAGTGLGSSSAVAVGVLNALHAYKGEYVSSTQLAEEAIKIEIDILKKPIGVQDQYAVALGGLRWISFYYEDSRDVVSERIKVKDIEDFNNSLMLLYTGVTRKTDYILSTFKPNNIPLLDYNKLLARNGVTALENGDLRSFAQGLDLYWQKKKELNKKVTNIDIDFMYNFARRNGAIGGKIVGAGGGGFLLIMFPANKRAKLKKSLEGYHYQELPFRFSDTGSKVILNI
jgi:D-glycero-alpha-D-manno-heptose-7-phosphate kinase